MNYSKLHVVTLAALTLTGWNSIAIAGTDSKAAPIAAPAPPPPPLPIVDLLVDVEFSSEYVTPRGMIVHDNDFTMEPLILGFATIYRSEGFLNSVKFVGGMWNDFTNTAVSKHAPFGSDPKTHYTEIDPIAGLSFGLAKYFTLDVTYTAFVEQIEDIGTSNHLETKLSFDDSKLLGGFGFHPYVSYWQELSGKATDADVPENVYGPSPKSGDHPQPGSSFYFDIGIDPTYTFTNFYGLKLDAPMRVLLPDERFYGDYYASASTVGLYELGGRATLPLKFVPQQLGHWGAHMGFRFMDFIDDNLYHLNTFNAPQKPTRTTKQVYGGITVFF